VLYVCHPSILLCAVFYCIWIVSLNDFTFNSTQLWTYQKVIFLLVSADHTLFGSHTLRSFRLDLYPMWR
jgi:hypothetical protein